MNIEWLRRYRIAVAATSAAVAFTALSCSGDTTTESGAVTDGVKTTVGIDIDGSSTVEPISAAVAEEFNKDKPDIKVYVKAAGTGGGFKKLAAGEIDICGASRPIKDEEAEACKKNGIEWIELPIAYDGLSVLVNPKNTFLDDITTDQLKMIWETGSKVKTWADVNPAWPKQEIKLYGPGTDSGTFDYFTEEINGEKGNCRSDYQPSEDDNMLVQGVAGDDFALGYFGYSYYEQNKDKLKLLKVNGILPTPETVRDGTYKPLSRPLFIYINKKSLEEKPALAEFITFYLTRGKDLVTAVGYVQLPEEIQAKVLEHFNSKAAGPSELLPKK